MSLLPTAHAGQSFGARRIDFYTVSGEVSASDDGTGRVMDTDGMTHDVRLLEHSNALAPGDTASVLRVQAGPNRRSRPAAIVNHTRGTWMRAAPDATALLARSGVTRSFNWWLSVLALALVAIAAVWPAIHGFLTEVNGSLMASVPAFDIYAQITAAVPGLSGWRLESALPSGLLDAIASLGFVPMDQLTEWGLALSAGLVTLLAFLGRSWRLIYIPSLAGLALAAGVILGSALPTLFVIGGSLAFFMLAGFVNRVRDGGRFNARVARLAEHALRNPPQEGVRSSEPADTNAGAVAASAAIAAAAATASGDAISEAPANDAPANDGDEIAAAARVSEGSAQMLDGSGEVEAPAQDDLLPAAPTQAGETAEAETPDAAGEAEAAPEVEAVVETDAAASDEAPIAEGADAEVSDAHAEDATITEANDDAPAAVTADAAEDTDSADGPGEEASEAAAPQAGEVEAETVEAADADAEPVVEAAAADAEEGTVEPVASADEADDDLPSLDAVAAAAALTASESAEPDSEGTAAPTQTASSRPDLDDERTMPVPPPPPMPDAETAATSETHASELTSETEPTSQAASEPAPEPTGAEPTAAEPIVDDPLMDEAGDPMVSSGGAGDYAPGAPDIDLDRTPAE